MLQIMNLIRNLIFFCFYMRSERCLFIKSLKSPLNLNSLILIEVFIEYSNKVKKSLYNSSRL